MKVAVLSDIHDRLDHLEEALEKVKEEGVERLLFLGDFCAPFSLAAMAKGFDGSIDAVFGNNDGDPYLLCSVAEQHAHVTLHGPYAELEIEGALIAIYHYPDVSKRLAESGAFAAVFSGHDHQRYVHQVGETVWANPGEIMGRDGAPSFGIFDTESRDFRHVIF